MPEAGAFRCAFNQSGNISQDNILAETADDAEVGCQGGEMIIPHFRPGAGDNAQDRTFPHVRVSDQANVGDRFQFKPERTDLGFYAGFRKIRSLAGRCGKMLIAPSAFSAFQQYPRFAGLIHISHHTSCGVVINHRAHRNFNCQVFPAFAGASVGLAVLTVFSGVFALEAKIKQRMHVHIGVDQDIPACAAVPAVRSAVDDKLFPMEGSGSIAAVSGFGCDFYTVNKIAHSLSSLKISFSWSAVVPVFCRLWQ